MSLETSITSPASTIHAAEYVRMSTDYQIYSIENQRAAIREYAASHGYEVVRSYIDPGKSGLHFKNRKALVQLLEDIQNGRTEYEAVLVYDVSRWGRFQDIDESAYYEYLCRRSKIGVVYCFEQFENDGKPVSAIVKTIKRAMAAEFSREQSARVSRAKLNCASRGHFAGGTVVYGLRRMLIGADGGQKGVLGRGVIRSIRQDHMILVPGPAEEVETVRLIFRYYVRDRMSCHEIARRLNQRKIRFQNDRGWSPGVIYRMIQNERYTGTLTYNKRSQFLGGPSISNPSSKVVRLPGAFEGIISQKMFDAAQRRREERAHHHYTEEELVSRLRQILNRHGYLTTDLINRDAHPVFAAYHKKFGNADRAYARVGFYRTKRIRDRSRDICLLAAIAQVGTHLIQAFQSEGVYAKYDRIRKSIVLNGKQRIALKALPYMPTPANRRPSWDLYVTGKTVSDATLLIRMATDNQHVLDFFFLPRSMSDFANTYRIGPHNLRRFLPFRMATLRDLTQAVMTHFRRAITQSQRPKEWSLGERLLARRSVLGLSLYEAAKKIGVTDGVLCRWERGLAKPQQRQRQGIERFLRGIW